MRSVHFPSCISPARRYLCRRKMLYNDAGNNGQGGRRKKTDVLEWIFREAEEKEIHSSRPAVVQEDHALQKEIKEVRIINEKKTLSRCGKAEYRVYLTKAVRFILKRDTCRSGNLFISPLSSIWKMMGKNAGNGKIGQSS